jgi:hypothetical protein
MQRAVLTLLILMSCATTCLSVAAQERVTAPVAEKAPGLPQEKLAACTYSLSPPDLSNIGAGGGARTITVTTPTSCPVTASSFQPWVTVNGIINNGSTTDVALQVSSNSGAARSTSIVVAGRLFLITQNTFGVGPWDGFCPGYTHTRLLVENWATPVALLTYGAGGFGPDDIVVVQFTTGNFPSGSNLLSIAGAEYGDPPTNRIAAMSDKPCDFVGLPFFGAKTGPSTSVTVPFTIDNPNNYGTYPILHVNTTYYLNVRMPADSGCAGSCNMLFNLNKNGNL